MPLQKLYASRVWKTEIRITRMICYYLSPFDSGCEYIFYRDKSTRKYLVPTLTKREVERNQRNAHKHRKAGSFSMAFELLLEQLPQ